MKKHPAVDMFCSIIADHIDAVFNGSIQLDEFAKRMRQSYDQAKAMEKEQIIDAFFSGYNYEGGQLEEKSEQYYTHTFTEQPKQ
jgi:hypothetical protein